VINVDAHLDVRIAESETVVRLIDNCLRNVTCSRVLFTRSDTRRHFASPVYYKYLRDLGVHRISLELLRSREEPDMEIKDQIRQRFIGQSTSLNTFFGFDLDAVRCADAPGTSAPSPLGLRAGEFIRS
jgi:arginase family enzyme